MMHNHQIGGRLGARAGSRRRQHRGMMSEINITPFVDVMLVLLVIFMVAAPLLTTGVDVSLPKAHSGTLSPEDAPLTVSIKAGGEVYVAKHPVTADKLAQKLIDITDGQTQATIFLRADKSIDYGSVMKIMGQMHKAGFTQISLITEHVD